jgi:hypothetical protein
MSSKRWLSVDKAKQLLRRCIYAFSLLLALVMASMLVSESFFYSIPVQFSDELWDWKQELDRDMRTIWRLSTLPHDRAVRVMTLAIRHAIRVYMSSFQTLVVIVVLTSFMNSWLKQVYIAAPVWMTDMTDSLLTDMGRSFSADEGECPDLVVDYNLANGMSMSGLHDSWEASGAADPAPLSRQASFSDEDVQRFQVLSKALLKGERWKNEHLGSLLEQRTTRVSTGHGHSGSDAGAGDGHELREGFVFDDEFGVIPESARDRWREERAAHATKRRDQRGSKNKTLPPVRYSAHVEG